jgi:hypothetical protein
MGHALLKDNELNMQLKKHSKKSLGAMGQNKPKFKFNAQVVKWQTLRT